VPAARPEPQPGPAATPPAQQPPPSPDARAAQEGGSISLNRASFDELRSAGFSVTQTGRLLAYRERSGGFRSIDELDSIPGFPKEFLDSVKHRLQP